MTVADSLAPVVRDLLGGEPVVTVRCWDGSEFGRPTRSRLIVRSPDALRRLLYSPDELGVGRAYVAGDLDIEGDVFEALQLRESLTRAGGRVRLGPLALARAVGTASRLGALGRPLPPPPEEARLRGRRHTRARDGAAVSHHYDVSNEFFRLLLGETMTYSCAFWGAPGTTLDDAQRAKYDLICRKLSLAPGMRLLDVGCGWGGMVIHAARHYGVRAVGVTVSARQAELARARVAAEGLEGQVDIRLQDYRDVTDGPYDAIASIGMFEHVGRSRLARYFATLHGLLRDEGRLMNHGICVPRGSGGFERRSFIDRYVFPDGELHEIGTVLTVMQDAGFEVRDLESLREHYALTLRAWVRNLESAWDEACRLIGAPRARVWRLYMAASALNFEAGRNTIHQALGVRPSPEGRSGMPMSRWEWLGPPLSVGASDSQP